MQPISHSRARAAGFSIVELMVAMGLSLLLLAGVATMFSSSRSTYEANDRLARVEENGRFALDSIVRDLRAAGYVGCSKLADSTNTLNNGGVGMWRYDLGVEGFDATSATAWTPALDLTLAPSASAGSDVLLVRVPRPGIPSLRLIAPMATTTDDLQLPKFPAGSEGAFKKNQILMISDCEHRSIFEVTDYDAQTGILQHKASTATATSPGNASDDLQQPYATTAATTALQSVIYYVRPNASGGSSLWRGVDGAAPEELVEGVETLQLRFGVDTNADRVADKYDAAKDVTNFANVISVSVALLVSSTEEYGQRVAHNYDVLDETVNTDDRRMRRVFATTSTVRNTAL